MGGGTHLEKSDAVFCAEGGDESVMNMQIMILYVVFRHRQHTQQHTLWTAEKHCT